jgi:hypothetical protein
MSEKKTDEHSITDQNNLLTEPLTLPMAQAMTVTATTELARLWLATLPGADGYLKAGWGVSVEMVLLPTPALNLSFIDVADGLRYPHARLEFKLE